MKNIQQSKALPWLKENSNILQESLSSFVGVLRKKSLDYTCFQFFQQPEYVMYVGTMFELVGYIIPFLEVALYSPKLFPAENLEVYFIFCEIDSSILEILLKYLDSKVFENFFQYHEKAFLGMIASVVDRSDTNTVLDENKIYNLKSSITLLCKYLLRESQIKEEGLFEKIQVIRTTNQGTLKEQINNILKALLNLNYSERIKDMFIEQILSLLMISSKREEIMIEMRHTMVNHIPQFAAAVDGMFVEIGLISLERPNLLGWRKKFGELIEWITTSKASPTTTPF